VVCKIKSFWDGIGATKTTNMCKEIKSVCYPGAHPLSNAWCMVCHALYFA
jgi:hypothetical protein